MQSPLLDVEPQAATQLDSVNDSFQLGVTESDSVNSGPTSTQDAITLSPTSLLHFDGNLRVWSARHVVHVHLQFTSARCDNRRRGRHGARGQQQFRLCHRQPESYLWRRHADQRRAPKQWRRHFIKYVVTLTAPISDIGTIANISFSRSNESLTPTGAVASADVLMPLGFQHWHQPGRITKHSARSRLAMSCSMRI